MSQEIPRDKNRKPLKSGQMVNAEFQYGIGPPRCVFGRIMYVGLEKSFVLSEKWKEGGQEVENPKIEVRIE